MKVEHHPNGFIKLIFEGFFGYRIRVHYWPKGAPKSESKHNHRWWFISIPLLGRFVDNRYTETQGGDSVRIKVLDRDDVRDSSRVYTLEGASRLRLRKRYIRYPLVPYLCRLGEIHSYYPHGNGRHASLVIISPIKVNYSEIWREPGDVEVELEG